MVVISSSPGRWVSYGPEVVAYTPTKRSRPSLGGVSGSTRSAVVARDGLVCQYCHLGLSLDSVTIDHRTPVSRGGGDELANLCVACAPCNTRKGASTVEEWLRLLAGGTGNEWVSLMRGTKASPYPWPAMSLRLGIPQVLRFEGDAGSRLHSAAVSAIEYAKRHDLRVSTRHLCDRLVLCWAAQE